MNTRVAINGFGRIGRLVFRIIKEKFNQVTVVAVNDLFPADNLAYLLKHDSVHRSPAFSVKAEGQTLLIDGEKVPVLAEKDPTRLPWKQHEVEFVIESTAHFTDEEGARKHIEAGAKHVIITAPAKGNVPTFVMGVNEKEYKSTDQIVSNASCTTNCLAPLTKILLDHFGIEEGLMTTVHSVTSRQPCVDGAAKKDWRGGRAASINIIPSSTGAATAVTLCLPQLKGKLTGMAFRVPTTDVSALDLTVRLSKKTSYEAICDAVKHAAEGEMKGIVAYCDEEVVSSDFIGNCASCIFDQGAGIALNAQFFKLVAWYDNEMAYAHRVVDLLLYMAKVNSKTRK